MPIVQLQPWDFGRFDSHPMLVEPVGSANTEAILCNVGINLPLACAL